ncbi:ABC transporter ATP-binding protein [Lacticaseibacillus jixiensis]|uniref:ABC transporter ATP-binding protein n=1 Tax=Lacticaseibacillus jixiensis TaxID=3231926 RepID=UPI0036F1CA97
MLTLNDIAATYPGEQTPAIAGVDLTVAPGELVVVLGRSGCGKSTLLKVIAGYLPASRGQVLLDEQPIVGPSWERGVVFQNASLYPWLDVEQNLAFGLRMRHQAQALQASRIELALHQIGLINQRHARVASLSGGMKQRVALARVLVNQPRLALLDESFGALDAFTRQEMHQVILQLWQATHTAFFIITHDIDEALKLGQKIAVMAGRPGTIRHVIANPYFAQSRSAQGYPEFRQQLLEALDSRTNIHR